MLVKMTNWQFVSNSLNPSDIKFAQFGGFAPRTMSFYKYGRKKFFLPITEWLRSFRLETITDHLRRLESPFRVSLMVSAVEREPAARAQQRSVASPSYEKRNSSLCHSTDLKDRSRSEQSSNRDSPTCFVIPSEAARPN